MQTLGTVWHISASQTDAVFFLTALTYCKMGVEAGKREEGDLENSDFFLKRKKDLKRVGQGLSLNVQALMVVKVNHN